MIEITSDHLRKNPIGVACGANSELIKTCLSQEIITDFIDDYFGGKLKVKIINNNVVNISVKLTNLTVDDNFIEKYFKKIEGELIEENIEAPKDFNDLEGDEIEFVLNAMEELTDDECKEIIGETFSALVGVYGGSLECKIFTHHLEFMSK
jgi:hypothetical protein